MLKDRDSVDVVKKTRVDFRRTACHRKQASFCTLINII